MDTLKQSAFYVMVTNDEEHTRTRHVFPCPDAGGQAAGLQARFSDMIFTAYSNFGDFPDKTNGVSIGPYLLTSSKKFGNTQDFEPSEEGEPLQDYEVINEQIADALAELHEIELEGLEREASRAERLANSYALQIARMNKYGASYRAIAKQIGCSHQQVKRLVDAGKHLQLLEAYVAPNGLAYSSPDEYEQAKMDEAALDMEHDKRFRIIQAWIYEHIFPGLWARMKHGYGEAHGESQEGAS